ncbi:hypothetical protein BGW36DRAFT_353986 [Talaromyces proteolyticus]|uniref:Uncharacterized protein n=1 Tax=Talaromyces proteolyticus TaxID=1131652 RepID=A0AAD4L1T4_9EURO|nr:uncharacterized protein BGW36DRAFT_353986 [Talaromyces proteolyticus]KAH8705584.1 hypothetical protein BGW36DRAFT_353986 [Talaromyces proteolyticus]
MDISDRVKRVRFLLPATIHIIGEVTSSLFDCFVEDLRAAILDVEWEICYTDAASDLREVVLEIESERRFESFVLDMRAALDYEQEIESDQRFDWFVQDLTAAVNNIHEQILRAAARKRESQRRFEMFVQSIARERALYDRDVRMQDAPPRVVYGKCIRQTLMIDCHSSAGCERELFDRDVCMREAPPLEQCGLRPTPGHGTQTDQTV